MPDSTPDRVEELRRTYDETVLANADYRATDDEVDAAWAALRAEIELPYKEALNVAVGELLTLEDWLEAEGYIPAAAVHIRRNLQRARDRGAPVEVAPRETPTCGTCGDSQTVQVRVTHIEARPDWRGEPVPHEVEDFDLEPCPDCASAPTGAAQ